MAKRAKKATQGERIIMRRVAVTLCRPNLTLWEFRNSLVFEIPRKEAKQYDAALRKAFREGMRAQSDLEWEAAAGEDRDGHNNSDRRAAKYGVRL